MGEERLAVAGKEGGFYVEPSGDYTNGNWIEVDATINVDSSVARPGGGIKNRGLAHQVFVDGVMELGPITVTITYRTVNKEGYNALRDAILNGVPIGVANMTLKMTDAGSEGFQFNAKVMNWTQPQQLEDGVESTFELVPTARTTSDKMALYVIVPPAEP